MSVLQSFIDYVTRDLDEDDEPNLGQDRTGRFTDSWTQSMWEAWQASRKKILEEFELTERPEALRAVAVQFVAANLRALVLERSEKTPNCLPKTALFLKAASLFLESDVGMSDDTAYAAVDAEINTLCMNYVKENLK